MELSDRARAVLHEVQAAGVDDVAWKEGRVFSLAYYGGPEGFVEVFHMIEQAADGLVDDLLGSDRIGG